ncbi:ABC transporter ATP-binding protein/permease [Puniceicoccaceae bacterium K14]|nr:ABC transporter ATP-binding protein/permease [Puniceicoccaceae bacterium K14]
MQTEEIDEIRSKIDLSLWKQIFGFALGHKRILTWLTVSALSISLTEALFPIPTKMAVDVIQGKATDYGLWLPSALFAVLTVSLCIGVYYFIKHAGSISYHVGHDIKRESFKRLQELEFAFYDSQPTGWLISRLTADCDRLSRIIAWGFLDIVWGTGFIIAMAIVMLILKWQLALIVLGTVPPLIVISLYFKKRLLESSREVRKENARITASYNECISGVKTTKTLGREDLNLREFEGMSQAMESASNRNATFGAVYMPIVMTIGSAGAGIVLWYGGKQTLASAIELGTLIAFINYAGSFFNPINQIASVFTEIQSAQAAGERVTGLLNTKPKIVDSETVVAKIEAHSKANSKDEKLAPDGHEMEIQSIEFQEASFFYKENEPILRSFNLKVEQGQTVALVGPSGGGKSTIVSILSRFYEPQNGEVLINGLDYRQRSLEWLQSQLGIVLQTPHLFSGTIRENIRYGNLAASDQDIEQAATIVNAHSFISNLENGYDTQIGEGGAKLSTGEKQLVSFARALIADPQVFIMDEATSSIDTEAEQLIQKGLQKVFDGRISFVIAHRLSTIRSADVILVIKGGEIEEQGDHESLMEKRGYYHKLYTTQFKRERVETVLNSSSN